MHPHQSIAPLATTGVAFAGGLVAQATPSTGVGAAGLIASVTALLVAGFQYFKAILDARQQEKRIEEQAKQIAELKADLDGSRERRHADAAKWNGQLQTMQLDLMEERTRRARLEGQLGVIDGTHADAINTNGAGLKRIGSALGIQVPAAHVDPLTPDPDPDPDPDDEEGPSRA